MQVLKNVSFHFHLFETRSDERRRLLRTGRVEAGLLGLHRVLHHRRHRLRSPGHGREIHSVQMHKSLSTKGNFKPHS
jgi:hypothetical protein